ncbi:iron-siderophore ABC transporter substrate-binding protein [Nocardioides hungaricus]
MTPLDIPSGLGRRGFLTVIGGAAVAALSACTNDANSPSAPTSGSTGGSAGGDAFPVTVTHKFGETTIPAAPQRIVALGQTDCDPLIALGITPVAIGSFLDDWYNPVFPWNEAGFDGKPEEVRFFDIEFEKVAALAPDLITMVSGGITKKEYETLSKIAPVVAAPVGYADSAVPYGPHTELIGRAVGKEAEALEAVAALDEQFSRLREEYPDWQGLTAVHAEAYTGSYYVLGENAPRTTFLTSLGFVLSPELADIVGEEYSKEISAEKLDLVGDLDLVVWSTDEGAIAKVQANPVISQLDSVKTGNAIWMTYAATDTFMWAMDWSTVLSTPHAIQKGIPLIEAALAGESPIAEDFA